MALLGSSAGRGALAGRWRGGRGEKEEEEDGWGKRMKEGKRDVEKRKEMDDEETKLKRRKWRRRRD